MKKLVTIALAGFLLMGFDPGALLSGTGFPGGQALYGQSKKGDKKGKKNKKTPPEEAQGKTKNDSKLDYLFIEANTQYLENNKEEAIGLFKEVLKLDGNHTASMYNIARISRELEDFETAAKYARMTLENDQTNYWYFFEMVKAHENLRQYEKAVEVQEDLVEHFPEDKNGLFDLAQLYIGRKDYPAAVRIYDRLESLIGFNEDVVFRKHQLYLYVNQPEKSMLEIDKLIAFNPWEQRYYQAKHDLYMGLEQPEKALQVLRDLLEFNPEDGFALLALADHYQSKGDLRKSDEYLFRAFRNPEVDLKSKVSILGSLYMTADDSPESKNRLRELGEILFDSYPDSPLVLGIQGDIFHTNGQLDSARTWYLRSLKADGTNQEVWQELLLIDAENSDYESMSKDAEAALEYFPNKVEFLYFFGLGSAQTEDQEAAIYAFEKIKKIGSAEKNLRMQAFMNLGELYHREEQYRKSDENFEAALELSPNDPSTLNNYAYFLSLRNEQLDRAAEMVKKAIAADPASTAYQDTYGWILYLQGDYTGAEEWIGKAVTAGTNSTEVLEHYGDVWIKLGNAEKARQYWQQAIANGATDLDMDDKIKKAGIK